MSCVEEGKVKFFTYLLTVIYKFNYSKWNIFSKALNLGGQHGQT